MDLDLFNYVPMEAFAHLSEVLKSPLPISALRDRDRFYSWTLLASEPEPGGKRLLLQYPDGGLAWIQVDPADRMYNYRMVSDDEARGIWPRLILQTSAAVRAQIAQHMRPGLPVESALCDALGSRGYDGLLPLGDAAAKDGSVEKRYLMDKSGVLCVWVGESGTVVRTAIVDGNPAWAIVQPVIDTDD